MNRVVASSLTVLASVFVLAACTAPTDTSTVDVSPDAFDAHPACTQPCTSVREVRLYSIVGNSTYRPTAQITQTVLDAIRAKLATQSNIDVDEGRDPTTSSNALQLRASAASLVYQNGTLSAQVKLAVFRYPSLALVGTIARTVSMADVAPFDTAKEDQVISAATTLATQAFVANLYTF